MPILTFGPVRSRLALVLLAALALSACAGARTAGKAPPRGSYFTAPVFPGDSLASVAERYGVAPDDLAALNNIKDRNRRLSWGQLRVPASASAPERSRAVPAVLATVSAPPATAGNAPPIAAPRQARPASIDRRSLAPLPSTSMRAASVKANGLDAQQAPPREQMASLPPAQQPPTVETPWYDMLMPSVPPADTGAAPHFLWPLEGDVISPFGDNPNGRNDGINISAVRGTPVRAAEAGEVTYVGNELKSYGNLILIRHDNGYVTAYAHTDGVHVKRGERVERGQVIGSAGDTGDVTEVQLHFELRHGTRPVDPTPFLVAPPDEPLNSSTERLAEGSR